MLKMPNLLNMLAESSLMWIFMGSPWDSMREAVFTWRVGEEFVRRESWLVRDSVWWRDSF